MTNSINLQGPVRTDVRYGGAGPGAIIGFFLFTKALAGHPMLALIIAIGCTAITVNTLLQDDLKKGVFTLAVLIALPLLFSVYAFRMYRRGR